MRRGAFIGPQAARLTKLRTECGIAPGAYEIL
jgi:hypothetical protein